MAKKIYGIYILLYYTIYDITININLYLQSGGVAAQDIEKKKKTISKIK